MLTDNDSHVGNLSENFFPVLKQPLYMILIYSFAYALVFITSIIGNTMVTSVVIKKRSMHSVTNYFLVNLAIADILVTLFCVPVNLMINLYNGKSLLYTSQPHNQPLNGESPTCMYTMPVKLIINLYNGKSLVYTSQPHDQPLQW